jgi:hypothetical protein
MLYCFYFHVFLSPNVAKSSYGWSPFRLHQKIAREDKPPICSQILDHFIFQDVENFIQQDGFIIMQGWFFFKKTLASVGFASSIRDICKMTSFWTFLSFSQPLFQCLNQCWAIVFCFMRIVSFGFSQHLKKPTRFFKKDYFRFMITDKGINFFLN